MTDILVIDDEPQIRRFLGICLASQGYHPVLVDSAVSGLKQAERELPDLVILDLGLPDLDGQDVLIRLRTFYRGPVIVLSVRNAEREKVMALDNGANDYVQKPFGANELLARVRSVLRTFHNDNSAALRFDDGHLCVDGSTRQVLLDGRQVHLSPREFDLLYLLLSRPGRLVTQQQILKTLWGPSHTQDTHYLRVFIARLRARLGESPAQPRYIETESGVGYRFMGKEL
jgi:two-component system, OmpR family, KDP operon response regulator KdpE